MTSSYLPRPAVSLVTPGLISPRRVGVRPSRLLLIGFLALCLLGPAGAEAQLTGPTIGGERNAAKPETIAPGWLEKRWAQSDLERLAAAARASIEDRGALPPGCDFGVLSPDYLPPPPPVDPWGWPYRLVGGADPAVLSSGPDGRFGTADDLVLAVYPSAGSELAGVGTASPAAASPASAAGAPGAGSGAAVGSTATPGAAPRATSPTTPPSASAESRATRERMRVIAEALAAFHAREGHYPEHDDATRLLRLLEVPGTAEDAWGRVISYLSLNAGGSSVLVSRDADGRFGHSLEDYLRGAAPNGDIVFLDTRER